MIKTKTIKLKDIVIDAGTQQREKINDDVVAEYAEAMRCGTQFPPVAVFFNSVEYYLADGFHRYFACKSAEIGEINAEIHDGTKRDAILYSFSVNGTHGLRRTNADKRKSVIGMLADDVWTEWSNRDIAKHVGVSHFLVNKLRDELKNASTEVELNSTFPLKPAPILETDQKLSTGSECKTADIDTKEKHEFDEDAIRAVMIDEFDPVAEIEKAHKEIDQLNAIIESDDKLAAAIAEIKRLNALIEVIESQKRAFQSSENAAKQAAKMWKNKYEKLERSMKASGLVEL